MPRGDKSSYTDKQKRQAEHIEEGYEKRGVPDREAARRAWATVNKETHGGKKSGSGRGTRGRSFGRAQRRPARRTRSGEPVGHRPLAFGQESGRDPQETGVPLADTRENSTDPQSRHRRVTASESSRPLELPSQLVLGLLQNSALGRRQIRAGPIDVEREHGNADR